MDTLRPILLILHVAVAATAFGVSLAPSGTLKRAKALGWDALRAATVDFKRRDGMAAIAGFLVLVTGLALIMAVGGFKGLPPEYHAALGIVVVMNVLGAVFNRPTANKLIAAAQAQDEAGVTAGIKRAAMGAGIMQLLWTVTLVLMFLHRF
ncbi:MAG: hypothetical protein EP329_27680 [Deltaproteobacteria bacterium]|nr:MAG: hypothetical protein EP329_27680 [Deltaproteobacteria bacterium]